MTKKTASILVVIVALVCLVILVLTLTAPAPRPDPSFTWAETVPAPGPGLPGERSIPPNVSISGSNIYYVSWSVPTKAVPPTRPPDDPLGGNYPVGLDGITYLTSVSGSPSTWDTPPSGCNSTWCSTSNIDWSPYDSMLSTLATRNVTLSSGQVIPQPFSLNIPSGFLNVRSDSCGESSSNPCNSVILPSWMQGYTFLFQTEGGRWYKGIRYDDPVFRARIKQFINEAAERYRGHPQIKIVRLYLGLAGETQPTGSKVGAPDSIEAVIKAHEQTVTCTEYMSWIREISEYASDQFYGYLPVVVMAGPGACSQTNGSTYSSGQKVRYNLQYEAGEGWEVTAPKYPIGFSMNYISPDYQGADSCPTCDYRDWFTLTFGKSLRTIKKPTSWESATFPSNVTDPWQVAYWDAVAVCGAKGDAIMQNSSWSGYWPRDMWNVVDGCFGQNPSLLSIWFRDAEYPTYSYAVVGGRRGESGFRGTFGNWLSLVTATPYVQACNSEVKNSANAAATAIASNPNNTIERMPCGANLPTPAVTPVPTATEGADMLNRLNNRQALRLDTTATPSTNRFDVVLESAHPSYGQTKSVTLKVTYLDSGTDTFTVKVPLYNGGAGGVSTWTITKTDSKKWVTSTTVVSDVLVSNALSGQTGQNAFVVFQNGTTGSEYISRMYVTLDGGTPTPTATPTETATATPTTTATPTRTATPSITQGVRLNEVSPSAIYDWTLSGDVNPADRWFEIVNYKPTTTNLAGYRVSNGSESYTFTTLARIIPYGRKVFLAEDTISVPVSGTLSLYNASNSLISSVTYSTAPTSGACYATQPDASETWSWVTADYCTPGSQN